MNTTYGKNHMDELENYSSKNHNGASLFLFLLIIMSIITILLNFLL
jgi:hypothetical protein